MKQQMKTLHFQIEIRLNEDTWGWHEPRTEADIQFKIPLDLFDAKTLATLIGTNVQQLKEDFPQAVIEYEGKKAEEEAQKALEEEQGE